MLTVLYSVTGHYAIGFMALSQAALASLILVIWMYYKDKIGFSEQVIKNTIEGIMITNKNGKIISVNPAFTEITGYQEREVIRSEEHTSELQSRGHVVCRLLFEKKK